MSIRVQTALPLLSALLLATTAAAHAQLASKITHYDVSKTRNISAVHDGSPLTSR